MTRRIAASLPLAVVLLDVTVVAVLLPDIRLDLGSSTSGGLWVLNAYLLALAALYPLLAQLRGGRVLPVAGALAMVAGAVVCVAADSTAALVGGRALQGAGTAAVLASAAAPQLAGGLAGVALPMLALALGPLVGGVFAEQNWWRVFFWAGIPLAAVAGAAALVSPRAESGEPRAPARLLAFAGGLTAVTIVLVQAEPWGWGWVALPLVVGLIGISGLARKPSAVMWATLTGCLMALIFLVPEYFQLVRNLSGLRSGILLLAVTFAAVTTWALAGWLSKWISNGALGLGGSACAAIGLALLIPIDVDTRYAILIGSLGLAATGLGLAAGAVSRMPRTEAASPAAGLAGAALGLAAAGAVFQLAQADERDSGATFEHALAAGVGWAAIGLLALLAAAVLAVWQDRRATRPTPASSAAPPAAGS